MPANIVIDTSAILAVLLDESEKRAVVEATMGASYVRRRPCAGRSGTPPLQASSGAG
jgi:hypothetical protein